MRGGTSRYSASWKASSRPSAHSPLSPSFSQSLFCDPTPPISLARPQERVRQARTDTFPVVEAIAREAKELAESSKVPGISEVAKLLVKLLDLVEERRNNVVEARETAEWCQGTLHVLTQADRVLREVGPRFTSVATAVSSKSRLQSRPDNPPPEKCLGSSHFLLNNRRARQTRQKALVLSRMEDAVTFNVIRPRDNHA